MIISLYQNQFKNVFYIFMSYILLFFFKATQARIHQGTWSLQNVLSKGLFLSNPIIKFFSTPNMQLEQKRFREEGIQDIASGRWSLSKGASI